MLQFFPVKEEVVSIEEEESKEDASIADTKIETDDDKGVATKIKIEKKRAARPPPEPKRKKSLMSQKSKVRRVQIWQKLCTQLKSGTK